MQVARAFERQCRAAVGAVVVACGVVTLACPVPARAEPPAPGQQAEDGDGTARPVAGQQAEDGDGTARPARPPRPPLPPAQEAVRLPWARHIEIGGDVALVNRIAATGDGEPGVRYKPAVGYGLHARWEIVRYLRFSAFFVRAEHELAFLPGALSTAQSRAEPVLSLAPGTRLAPSSRTRTPSARLAPTVRTLSLGARLAPTWPLSERARSWVSAGVGYDRLDVDSMLVSEAGGGLDGDTWFTVRGRGASFVAIPLGMGVSFDLVRNWLTIELETSASILLGKGGDAMQPGQAIDRQGQRRMVGGLPRPQASFMHTVGLSLVL
jgi:hypothetical protein